MMLRSAANALSASSLSKSRNRARTIPLAAFSRELPQSGSISAAFITSSKTVSISACCRAAAACAALSGSPGNFRTDETSVCPAITALSGPKSLNFCPLALMFVMKVACKASRPADTVCPASSALGRSCRWMTVSPRTFRPSLLSRTSSTPCGNLLRFSQRLAVVSRRTCS